jgi:hypothetical protein
MRRKFYIWVFLESIRKKSSYSKSFNWKFQEIRVLGITLPKNLFQPWLDIHSSRPMLKRAKLQTAITLELDGLETCHFESI